MASEADTQAFVASLDTGKTSCILLSLCNQLLAKEIKRTALLAFSIRLTWKVNHLDDLIQQWNGLDEQALKNAFVRRSVVKWLHFNNKIEMAGYEEEADTDSALSRLPLKQKDKEVFQSFELLKQNYDSSPLTSKHTFDPPRLKQWHLTLMKDLHSSAGHFRRAGAESSASTLSPLKHVYPHHSIVSESIGILGRLTYDLALYIEKKAEVATDKLRLTFALAAFAQFHFVDIHPFEDGNGRICRFISKYILDSVCGLPFPMFEDREKYFSALLTGRQVPPVDAPHALMELLLDAAISHYQNAISTIASLDSDITFTAASETALLESLRSDSGLGLSESDMDILVTKWKSLDDGSSHICSLQGSPTVNKMRIKLLKIPTYVSCEEFDEL